MNHTIRLFSVIIICFILCFKSNSQTLNRNNCDKLILSAKEYEKCLEDSAWNYDIIAKTNYISFIKTELFPKFRQQRKRIEVPDVLNTYLLELKNIYDSALKNKIWIISKEMEKNQYYIQPKAYISSVLSFEIFKFYPDINAILINYIPGWNSFNIRDSDLIKIQILIQKIQKALPQNLYILVKDFTTELEKDRLKYKEYSIGNFLQGYTDDQTKQLHNIINFLIWNE